METGNDLLIVSGGALKALGEGKVGGYGVFFTNEFQPDLDGEFFTSQTSFELEDRKTLPLYFGHGTDPTMKKRKLGKATFKETDEGLWVETVLDTRDRWLKKIYELIQQGKLSYSSGAISHLVEKESKGSAVWLKTWPIGEMSFTPCPAAPHGTEVMALKFYREPSLEETIRRASLTEWQIMREDSERLRERALAVLEGTNPETWATTQIGRAASSSEQRAAQRDWIKMRGEAKAELEKCKQLHADWNLLIANQKAAIRDERSKHWQRGHNCAQLQCAHTR